MKSQPPTLASWLLREFGAGPDNETIAGDLNEQYRMGRSRIWYWRQVVVAIVVGTWNDIQTHSVLALRAVILGFALTFLVGYVGRPLFDATGRSAVWVGNWLLTNELESLRLWWFRLHLYNIPTTIIWCLVYVGIGWTIGRAHRAHRMAMVFAFITVAFVWDVFSSWRMFGLWMFSSRLRFDLFFFAWLYFSFVMFVVRPLSTILGGMLAAPRHTPPERTMTG
jgi:hypothetical protein